MTVNELIKALSKFPDHAPVQVYTAEGTFQDVTGVDDNTEDSREILPIVAYLCCEDTPR